MTAYTRHDPPPTLRFSLSLSHPDDDCRNLLNENWSSFFGIKLPALMDERTHTKPHTHTHRPAAAAATTLGSIINTSKPQQQQQQQTSESSQLVGAFCGDSHLHLSHLFRRFRVSKFNLCILYVCCCCCCCACCCGGYATPATQTTATRSAYAAYGCWQRRQRQRRRLPILQLLLLLLMLLRLALLACCGCLLPVPAPRSQSAVENCKFRKIDFLVVIFGYAKNAACF